MSYFYNTNLKLDILPWIYSVESNNTLYMMTFQKLPNIIQDSVYNAFYTGNTSDIFNDYDAANFLQLANLQSTVFTNTLVSWSNTFVFTGKQLGAANTFNLYWLRSALIYNYNPNNSYNEDGTFGLQFWNFNTNDGGKISLPTPFIFDKNANSFGNTFSYNNEPFLYFLMGLNNANLAQGLVLLQTNPLHGFVSNKVHTLTSNSSNTFVSYLPSLNVSTTGNTVYNDFTRQQTLNIQVCYSNGTPYPNANTEITVGATQGYVSSQKIVTNNSIANVGVSGLFVSNGQTINYSVGWPNYANATTVNITVLNSPNGNFSVPGTYTFPVPIFNTLTVQVWGAGGGGGGQNSGSQDNFGSNGTNSSFAGTILATGGQGGGVGQGDGGAFDGFGPQTPLPGVGSGGDINLKGSSGAIPGIPPPASSGGIAGTGGLANGISGAGGGYSKKTYVNNAISGNVTIVVGQGGAAGIGTNATAGVNGAVVIAWS